MKFALIIITALILFVILALFVLGFLSHKGNPGGMIEGRLSKCPNSPNCACSEYEQDDDHYFGPLPIPAGEIVDVSSRLKSIIAEMGGTLQKDDQDYLAATFTSTIFRFVDDLEIRIDREHKLVHLRSASRVGRDDLGANRKRLEQLKSRYLTKSD